MNNADFRSLVANTPRRPAGGSPKTASRNGSSSSLGSKARSSIPMTPRTVRGGTQSDFARQLAEQRAGSQPQKKFRSSAAPKGVKLSGDYVDRARLRGENDAQDDKEARIRALEEQAKLGQIDQATFEQLRDQITGGDLSSTHLVKGLDLKLLERIKRGENVREQNPAGTAGPEPKEDAEDEDEFDKLEAKEITSVQRNEQEKKGAMAPPPLPKPVAGVKRSRNEILAELKASRKAAEEAKATQPGKGFHRISAGHQPSARIETDDKGREFLITVDEHGRTKRKVRKVAAPAKTAEPKDHVEQPLKVLGADVVVPEAPPKEEEDEDDDIFQGAGDAYDPLGDGGEDDEDSASNLSEDDGELPATTQAKTTNSSPEEEASAQMPPPPKPAAAAPAKRNYFAASDASGSAESAEQPASASSFNDPAILAALKRASAIASRADADGGDGPAGKAPSTAAERLLGQQRDRDMDDMDLGFGSSRAGDEEEGEEDGRIKLREWKGLDAGGDDGDGDGQDGRWTKRGGQKKPRRRKKKGDKNSAADVMRVIEGRR